MREAFISILILAIFAQAKCSEIGKDGFNYYKDYLRARSDLPEEPVSGERMLYVVDYPKQYLPSTQPECTVGTQDFYRTPLQLSPSLLPALEQEYKKRTGNAFKNHMLNKELWTDGEMPGKRSSKTGLALLMQNKQPYYIIERPSGNIEVA